MTNYIARARGGFMKTQTTNLDKRLFLRPREVEDIFGIKESTLRRQRTGNYGFPFFLALEISSGKFSDL